MRADSRFFCSTFDEDRFALRSVLSFLRNWLAAVEGFLITGRARLLSIVELLTLLLGLTAAAVDVFVARLLLVFLGAETDLFARD